MALVINDRVKETSTTTGTGTLDLAGAVTGFVTFVAGIGDTNTTYYAIFEQGTVRWEVGLGTVTDAATDTLARTTVINNSSGNTDKITFAGTLDVFCTLPASKSLYLDAAGALANATVITDANINATGTASSSTFLRGDNSWTAVSGGSVTTLGETFDNYNDISSSADTTMVATKNYYLKGPIDVTGSAVWDVKGSGVLTIL